MGIILYKYWVIIFECYYCQNNKCGAYETLEYNFPLATRFAFKQLYSYDENYI